jgi:hypothetical protein
MYEMEGPYRPRSTGPPIARRPCAVRPASGRGLPRRAGPVSRSDPPPGLPPDGSSFSVVREVLLPLPTAAQGVSGSKFKIFWSSTRHPQNTCRCPPRSGPVHRFIHSGVHSCPRQGGRHLDPWPPEPSTSARRSSTMSSRTAAAGCPAARPDREDGRAFPRPRGAADRLEQGTFMTLLSRLVNPARRSRSAPSPGTPRSAWPAAWPREDGSSAAMSARTGPRWR